MALILTPRYGSEPLTIYSDGKKVGSQLELTVTGLPSALGGGTVTWKLEDADGTSVQAGLPPGELQVIGGRLIVPTVATLAGDLTLTVTEKDVSTNFGTLSLTSVVLTKIALSASPNPGKIGTAETFTAALEVDDSGTKADGLELNWSSSPSGEEVIPVGATPKITDSTDEKTYQLLTNPLKASMLDNKGQLNVTLKISDNGSILNLPVKVDRVLLPPESMIPLKNNTIDDNDITAATNNGFGGLPFRIQDIQNYVSDSFLVLLTGKGDILGVAPVQPVGEMIWPLMMKANTIGGAFDYTGPMEIFYIYQDATTTGTAVKGVSKPLMLQVSRKDFPGPSPIDAMLPRPRTSTTSYKKAELFAAKDFVVNIPLVLETGSAIFQKGDQITIKIVLTGYTADNEGLVTQIASSVQTLRDTDLGAEKTTFPITFSADKFTNIDGSLGSVSYTLRRGKNPQRQSPGQALAVDTVEAFSRDSAFHISKMAVLASKL